MRDRDEIYVRRPTDPWIKAVIAGLLIDLFRRPLTAIFLTVMVVLALAMLIVPQQTALVLAALIGLGVVHHVRRRVRR